MNSKPNRYITQAAINKRLSAAKGKNVILGVALFFLLAGVLCIFDGEADAFFGAASITAALMIAWYFKNKKEKYFAAVFSFAEKLAQGNSSFYPIDSLENKFTKESASILLYDAVEKGYLQNIRIDGENGRVIVLYPEKLSVAQAPKPVAVACSACGAKYTLEQGSVKICEYCGSPVSGR